MENRIASLFALDDLLSGKSNGRNGHNGHGTTKRRRRKHARSVPNANAAPGKAANPHNAFHHRHQAKKTYAQSFDTGAPIRCEHNVAYVPVEKVQVPSDAPTQGGSALSFDVGDGYTVEAFEDDDEADQLTALPDLQTEIEEIDKHGSEAVRASSYEEPTYEPQLERGAYEHRQPASFAAQMNAVERDLADLATRVQQPPAEPNASAPVAEDEAGGENPPAPAPTSGHGVFDSMAKGMSYATEFRLPSVQLSQVFSALDRQLDAENAAPPPAQAVVNGPAPNGVETLPPNDVLIKDLVAMPPKTGDTPAQAVAPPQVHSPETTPAAQ